jgi:plasmid replication initiation protein
MVQEDNMKHSIMISEQNELESIDIKNWITKSNELIESTYKLSLQEQRILLVMASKVQPNDETLKTYRFRARDFIEIVGNKKGTGFYSYLKEIVNGLQTKVLTIKKDGKQRNYNWVITSIYEDMEGSIQLQFHPELKGFFLELKEKFTSYQLENVVRLNSIYSIRIYELLKQYEKLKKRKLTIDELRHYLAIDPSKYKQYGHFKSKVLLVAQDEINKKTDIKFEFIEFKTGRKITAIEFDINGNLNSEIKVIPVLTNEKPSFENSDEAGQLPTLDISKEENPLKFQLTSLGVSTKKVDEILNNYSEEQILRNIHYVQAQMEKGSVERSGPYLVKTIEEDWGKEIDFADGEINNEAEKTPSKETIVNEFIKIIKPSKKSKEFLPNWFIKEDAINFFIKYMSKAEAYQLWKEKESKIMMQYETVKYKLLVDNH